MILSLVHYAWRTMTRHKLRSALTIGGIATAMFLFCFIEQIDLPIEYDFGFLGFATKQILTQKCILFLQALDLR